MKKTLFSLSTFVLFNCAAHGATTIFHYSVSDTDAAGVMQALSAEPAYAEVTAPQAISRVGNSDEDQFYLDLRIAEGVASGSAAEDGP